MKELELQRIWLNQASKISHFFTVDGKTIAVLSAGIWNKNQGPDFLFATIKIDGQMWFGNIELHIKTSDWFKHGHHKDSNYSNVILHVVLENDMSFFDSCPILVLDIELMTVRTQKSMGMDLNTLLICPLNAMKPADDISNILEALALQRLENKKKEWSLVLDSVGSDWDCLFWNVLAGGFGLKVNADTFQSMAFTIPFYVLKICQHDLFALEALFLGQAGLLAGNSSETYFNSLKERHLILKSKFGLDEIHEKCNFLRMRPENFPTIRLAQLSAWIHQNHSMSNVLLECKNLDELYGSFQMEVSWFWKSHYTFDKVSKVTPKMLGSEMFNVLVINALIPYMLLQSEVLGEKKIYDKALIWAQNLPLEQNNLTKRFIGFWKFNATALSSQGLKELVSTFCNMNSCCRHCRFTN